MAFSGGVCDTRCQNFFTTIIKNEDKARLRWFIKHRDQLLKNLENPKLIEKIKRDFSPEKKSKKSKQIREEKLKHNKLQALASSKSKKNEDVDFNIMRPIDPKVRKILYEPGVESFTAKKNYLYQRFKSKPRDRFNYPECTSWVYGWHLKDHPPIPTSEVGLRSIIQSSFYNRDASSLTRDPDWYRMCQTKNPKNFNELLTY